MYHAARSHREADLAGVSAVNGGTERLQVNQQEGQAQPGGNLEVTQQGARGRRMLHGKIMKAPDGERRILLIGGGGSHFRWN
jgi:hypothetical protein